ncbi:Conserved_hypothetical protein [Hexamita inflata]|uniref:Transmembrane protein n=1 Tax=Hexamita inflata TaxID=28002 RepID=A0AA86UJL5_9EUKA|nr:Conserved hypothetical protein [Hexamita inflata]
MLRVLYVIGSSSFLCDQMLSSRIWYPLQQCSVNTSLNFDKWQNPAQNIFSDSTTLDARIITAASLYNNITNNSGNLTSLYNLFDVDQYGLLSNAHIYLNTSIIIDTSVYNQLVQISPFGNIKGTFDNVSVSGFVNLSVQDFTKVNIIQLSRFFGVIDNSLDSVNHPSNFQGSYNFRNVSSSLKYFVNNVEVLNSFSSVQRTMIDNQINSQSVNISVSNYQLSDQQNINHFTYSLTDQVSKSKLPITIWFPFSVVSNGNNNSNAITDLYSASLLMNLQQFYEIEGMTLRRFNANGIELTPPFTGVEFLIYQEDTKAVCVLSDRMIICSGFDVYDIESKKCVTRDVCFQNPAKLLFQSTCVLQCPSSHSLIFNKSCWSECPKFLNAYLSGGQCLLGLDQFSTGTQSVPSCSVVSFKKGCYDQCPVGTIKVSSVCNEPTLAGQCVNGQVLVLSGQVDPRFNNLCMQKPAWMFRIVDQNGISKNIYKGVCEGVIKANNDCFEQPTPIKATGLCQQQCDPGQYAQTALDICHNCLSDIYDGGRYFERKGSKCVKSCSKYSIDGQAKICEDNNPMNCPLWQVMAAGSYLCLKACGAQQFQDGQVCSSCNPLNSQVDKVTGLCKCAANFFIKNLPDGSSTCTECDNSLHFQDSKVNGVCICQAGYQFANSKCAPNVNCPLTQIFQGGVCSDCPQNQYATALQDACVSNCSPNYLNQAGTYCVSTCWPGTFGHDGSCKIDCPYNTLIDSASQTCVASCIFYRITMVGSSVGPFCQTDTCLDFLFINDQYHQTVNGCFSTCPPGQFGYNKHCYQKCPINTLLDSNRLSCVDSCSFYRITTIGSSVGAVCQSDTCQDFLYVNDQYHSSVNGCFGTCPSGTYSTRIKTCVKDCSIFDNYPNPTYCETPGSPTCQYYINIPNITTISICCSTCPDFYNGYQCVKNCELSQTIQGKVCSNCPQYQIPNANQDACMSNSSCSPKYLNLAGTYCVSTCSQFYDGFQCASFCVGFVSEANNSVCVQSCGAMPKGYINSTYNMVAVFVCLDVCPQEYPDYDMSSQYRGTPRCYLYPSNSSSCGASAKYLETNQKCVQLCASGMYVMNLNSTNQFQCLKLNAPCDKYYKTSGMKECYQSCPLTYSYLNGSECLQSCTPYMNDPKSITQKLCLSSCSGLNPYSLVDQSGKTQCLSTCGAIFANSRNKCISFCQFYRWDEMTQTKICVDTCNFYRIDKTKDQTSLWCGDSCSVLNYVYSEVDANGRNQCVDFCSDLHPFLDGFVCKQYCQFVVEQQVTAVSKYRCMSVSCQKYYYLHPSDNTIQICLENCFGLIPYNYGKQCVSSCASTQFQLIGTDGTSCVKNCSDESAVNKLSAVWYCDLSCNFYLEGNEKTCLQSSTAAYPYKQIHQQIQVNGIVITRYLYVVSCVNNEYALIEGEKICQLCIYFEAVGQARQCVSLCSSDQVLFKQQCYSGLCVNISGIGNYIYTDLNRFCQQSCGLLFVENLATFQCSFTCPKNYVYQKYNGQQLCVPSCTGVNNYLINDPRYAINGVGLCINTCPIGQLQDNLLQDSIFYCVDLCESKQYQIVNGEYVCVSSCPVYVIGPSGMKQCYNNCSDIDPTFKQIVISQNNIICVQKCPSSYPFMPSNGDLQCIKTCPSLRYSIVNNNNRCVDSCLLNTSIEQALSNHQICLGACDSLQKFVRTSGNIGFCVSSCPSSANFYDNQKECKTECNPKVYKIDEQQKQCLSSCDTPLNQTINEYVQCDYCQAPTPYLLLNNTCTNLCPLGTYLHNGICQLSCPSTMKYAILQNGQYVCSNMCPNKIYAKIQAISTYYCQDVCETPNFFRKDIMSGQIECLTQCDPAEFQYSNNECSSSSCLQDPVNKFSLGNICMFTCPDFVNFADYRCISECSGPFSGYVSQIMMNQKLRVCYSTCPTDYIDSRNASLYKSVGVCVKYCPTTEKLYFEPYSYTQFYCTPQCTGSSRFVQLDQIYCRDSCASKLFQTDQLGNNFCIERCEFPNGKQSLYSITQCLECPNYISEVDQSCVSTCDFYNVSQNQNVCRMVNGARNTNSCAIYTNDAAPFLCIQECVTFRDGPWCVKNCAVTGKKFVPASGFDCQSSCPAFYEYQFIFDFEQPRCNDTCNFMLSSADQFECQRKCNSNISVYVFGRTYCSNCSSPLQLSIDSTFSCSTCNSTTDLCTQLDCGKSTVKTDLQTLTGYLCESPFTFNYTTQLKQIINPSLQVSQVDVLNSSAFVLLHNGSVMQVTDFGSKIIMHNVEQISVIPIPPKFNNQLLVKFQNGSFYSGMFEKGVPGEKTVQIIGMFDPENNNLGINYLLTDQNLYFRGSCKSNMCTKDASGNDFDSEFNGKTKFRGMWTKMNLAEFPFQAMDVQNIEQMDWAVKMTLKNGKRYIYGLNKNGRLCQDPKLNIAIIDISQYDAVSLGNATLIMSKENQLYYCGESLTAPGTEPPTNEYVKKMEIKFTGLLGWQFLDNSILDITNIKTGFLIRTHSQVFHIGKCVAFDCYNLYGSKIPVSYQVQQLKWLTQRIKVVGNTQVNVQYNAQPLNIVYFNDTYAIEDDQQYSVGTLGWQLYTGPEDKNIGLIVAIIITSTLYFIAIVVLFRQITKYCRQKQHASLKVVKKYDNSDVIRIHKQENIFNMPVDLNQLYV